MKKKLIFPFLIALCLLIVLTGCNPLGPVEQKGLDTELQAPNITLQGTSATMVQLEWQPVLGATSYQITVKPASSTDPAQSSSINRTVDWLVANQAFSDGHFTYTVKNLDGKTSYTVSIQAMRGTTTSAISNEVTFTTKDPFESAPDIAPDAYIQAVVDDTATVYWRTIPGITEYVLSIAPKNSSTVPQKISRTETGASGTYTFTGLDESLDYTIWVRAAIITPSGETEESLVYTELNLTRDPGGTSIDDAMPIPEFAKDQQGQNIVVTTPQSITITAQPNPKNISTAADYVMLLRKDTLNGDFSAVAWAEIAGSSTVELTDDHGVTPGSVYYYALCNVKAKNPGNSTDIDARSKLSETIQVTSALKLSSSSTPNSVSFSWKDLGDDVKYVVTATMTTTDGETVQEQLSQDDITVTNGTCSLTYGGNSSPLISNTGYTIKVIATTQTNLQFTGTTVVTTGSWAGVYRWVNPSDTTGNRANFVVTVETVDPSVKSSYPYYVRINKNDVAYVSPDGDYRIMPLIDPAVDTDVPTDFIPYTDDSTDYEKAYRWNEAKWNTTTMHPDKWKIKTAPTADAMKKNIFTTVVNTVALGMTLSTTTTFEFRMYNGTPQLLFTNKGSGFATLGLYQNPAPNTAAGEGKNTFALKFVGEV